MTEYMPLARKLDELKKTVAKQQGAKIYQFPLWGEPQRGVPNDLVRCALFAAVKGMNGQYNEEMPVFSQAGLTITYNGPSLTQDHLDVFEAVMHLAREMPEGNRVRFTARGLLKLMQRGVGGNDRERLLRSLKHLTTTCITIKREKRVVYWGSLLPEGAAAALDEDDYYHVSFNRNLIKLFDRGFTVVEWKQRKELARSPLAKHLQLWLSSHEKPYSVTVQYLYDITGSKTKHLKRFRQSLIVALNRLKDIGVLADWRIDERGKVHFVKAS